MRFASPLGRPRPGLAPPGSAVWSRFLTSCLVLSLALLLGACGSTPSSGSTPGSALPVPQPYSTDGPLPNPPADLALVPDAEPKLEPVRSGGPNKPYQAAGEVYVPITDDRPVVERGLASWYGRKFHGRPTASGELYNMYAMTAAHPTLPIPSYARVRNPANGREVIVRVNDRGPFSKSRIVDLSYTAALKLDILRGVTPVELERITLDAIRTGSWRRDAGTRLAADPGSAMAMSGAKVGAATAARVGDSGFDTAQADGLSPGSPVRQRELWSQDLERDLPPPAAGPSLPAPTTAPLAPVVRPLPSAGPMPLPQALPQPLPQAPSQPDSARANAQAATISAAPTALPIPAALSLPPGAVRRNGLSPEPLPIDPARTSAGRGWWVQLGAFRERHGALDFQAEMARIAPWLAPLLGLFDEGGLHKLQAGPFPTRSEAQSALQRMKETLRLTPVLVERR